MCVYKLDDFPFVECGIEPKRLIRLIFSPYTTGDERFAIVQTTLPPQGISNAHIHEESDEYIYFLGDGKAYIEDKEFIIQKNSIVHAPKGVRHECINTGKEELQLFCLFIPSFKPYGIYPELIDLTRKFLNSP